VTSLVEFAAYGHQVNIAVVKKSTTATILYSPDETVIQCSRGYGKTYCVRVPGT
jgi:hypothetical protein